MKRLKLIRRLSAVIITYFIIYYISVKYWPDFYNHVENPAFVRLGECPFCFGHSFCNSLLLTNHAVLSGLSSIRLFNYFNVKNVFRAKLKSGSEVMLKKLSWDSEITSLGRRFCEMIDLSNCDVKNAVRIYSAEFMNNFQKQSVKSQALFGMIDILACPSKRFLSHLLNTFMDVEVPLVEFDRMDALAEFVTIIHLNPEPLILQSFKAEDGWPFPHFHGYCGQVIVEEWSGEPLSDYLSSPWNTRVRLSYQLLKIAEKLTFNPSNFSFYLTDVNLENFAVSSNMQLSLVDVENVIVVDKQKSWQDQPSNWNKTLANIDYKCPDCLSYSRDDLCTHRLSDHNFYAVCQGIIAKNSYYAGNSGFLHSIPKNINQHSKLKTLIDECAKPANNASRIESGRQLMALLFSLL